MAKAVDDYDCTTCGACCVGTWPDPTRYASVTREDMHRILTVLSPSEVDEVVAPPDDEGNRAMRVAPNAHGIRTCVALDGKVGGCVSCRIYSCRPKVCSDFRVYSDECLRARKREGIQP